MHAVVAGNWSLIGRPDDHVITAHSGTDGRTDTHAVHSMIAIAAV